MTDEEPGLLHREGFSRPETLAERIGYAASRWFGRAGAAIVLVLFAFGVVVGVPALVVTRSGSYRAARQYIAESDPVMMEIGEVVAFEKVPVSYRVKGTRAEYRFFVEGAVARGRASVTVDQVGGVWRVTSASFVSDPRHQTPGVHRKIVLVRGK